MQRFLPAATTVWSATCAVLGLWWVRDPATYPLDRSGAPTSLAPTSLSMVVPAWAAAWGFLVFGAVGIVLAAVLSGTNRRTPGRRALLLAGSAYAAMFGLLVPDVLLLSFLGYTLALAAPVVVTVLLAAGARRHPRNALVLAGIGLAVAVGVLTGQVGEPTVRMLRGVGEAAGEAGVPSLVLAWMTAGGVLFAALTVTAAGRGRTPTAIATAAERLDRWGRVATWVAAACPLPYALVRMTWLTPWPLGVLAGQQPLGAGMRLFGLLLGSAALGGAVLTRGLVSEWGEVFPAWLPGVRGRSVPVLAAVVPATVVSVVLCASAVSLVIMSLADGAGWIVAAIPAPLWGPALGLATYAYYHRRARAASGPPPSAHRTASFLAETNSDGSMLLDAGAAVSTRHTRRGRSDGPATNSTTVNLGRIKSALDGRMFARSRNKGPRTRRLYRVGAVSAAMLDALFLMGAASPLSSILQLDSISRWLGPLQNNWLVVLFELNARSSGARIGMLDLNALDSILIVLACLAFLGLYPTLRQVSKTWTLIALALPPTGLVLFLGTGMAGRLGIMSAMLAVSVLMLRSDSFSRPTAVLGMMAGTLLVAGDALTEVTLSTLNSLLIAIGYVFTVTWLFVISRTLFQLSRASEHRLTTGVN